MSVTKKAYPGVCSDYDSVIRALDQTCTTYKEISDKITEEYGMRISPTALSKYIRKMELQPLLGVVAPPEEVINEKEIDPKDLTPPEERELLEALGYDARYHIVGGKQWQRQPGGPFLSSYRVELKPVKTEQTEADAEEFNLPTLFAEASKYKGTRIPAPWKPSLSATVVCWADPQTGKVDKYGGIQEQYDRVYSIKDQLEDYIVEAKGDKALFLDAGDGVEGFENTGSQAFTNGLSLMDQIDLEATYEQSYIQLLAEFHNTVEVYGIDSNHAKWRSGKAVLGRPGDDWGRFIKRQLRKAFALNPDQYGHVSFDEPDMWDRTLNVDVYGTGIGLAHGDQVSSIDAIPKWWAGQSHGSQATADSEILITGHFHHFLMRQTGRGRNGRQKYHLGLPTLDNGSAWFEGQSGESSDPGLIVFQVNEHTGFNFDSLTMLHGM